MSVQQLHIQTSGDQHSAMVSSLLMAWTEGEADMYLVSEDGCRIYTYRYVKGLVLD